MKGQNLSTPPPCCIFFPEITSMEGRGLGGEWSKFEFVFDTAIITLIVSKDRRLVKPG
jgi:hypothetical protein